MNRKTVQYSVLIIILTLGVLLPGNEAPALQTPTADASVSVTPRNGFAPLDVQISVQVSPSSSPECIPDSFTISYGDGTPAESSSSTSQLSFAHTYSQPGTFFININYVRHENVGGSVPDCVRASASASAVVTVLTRSALQANISATPTSGAVPLDVEFDGSGSITDPNCPINNYSWNFGDGETDTGELVTHTYTDPALYTVTLTVFDDCNRSDNATTSIDVNQATAVFNGVPIFNLQIEPSINPACSCGNLSNRSGIVQVGQGCGACSSHGGYSGISQDTGGQTVLLHSGEFIHRETDLRIPGRGFDWEFTRTYRSAVTLDGPLGHGWEFNYNRRIIPTTPNNIEDILKNFADAEIGDVVRIDGYGRADLYKLDFQRADATALFTAPSGFYTSLELLSNGGFVERDRNGTLAVYDSLRSNDRTAHLTRLTDRNGNTMRFERNNEAQLINVIDTLGRQIDYFYDQDGRLISVRDYIDRTINFDYDDQGDLIGVTGPVVTGTPNGNNFPTGKTTEYAYSTGFTDPVLNHNLVSITAPNEVANNGPAYLRLSYDENTNSPTSDQVLTQTVGGTNSSNVPAGGRIEYEYFGNITRVTDRNGNQTDYEFNAMGNITRLTEQTNRNVRLGEPDSYETTYEYNSDGELTRSTMPEGNEYIYSYDAGNSQRLLQGNLLSIRELPDNDRGGDQSFIETSYGYEPIYNQINSILDPRGNNASYVPDNGGSNTPDRYTTEYFYDYQEGNNVSELALEFDVSESEIRALLGNTQINLGDLNGDGITNQISGNVVRIEHPNVQLLFDSNQRNIEGSSTQPIVETFVYNDAGQLVRETDPEGNVTLYEYYPENDPDGDGSNFISGASNDPIGYLKSTTEDALSASSRNSNTNPTPVARTIEYLYDRVGNVIGEMDGRGVTTEYSVNQLNQVVQVTRAADVSQALGNNEEPNWSICNDDTLLECSDGMKAFSYLTRIYYDHNNNVIISEVENRDSNNPNLAGTFVETIMRYDILNNLVEISKEASESPLELITTRYRYDRNENLVVTLSPVAVDGTQPSNVVSVIFDERDLPFETTQGGLTLGFQNTSAHSDIPELRSIPNSIDISSTTQGYDGNRNINQYIDSLDNSGNGAREESNSFYDGFDRLISHVDPLGNQSFMNYDPASNLTRYSFYGPVGGESPISNNNANLQQPMTLASFNQPLLERTEYLYDELSRVIEKQEDLFTYELNGVEYQRDPVLRDGPLGTNNDNKVQTRYEYDRNGRLTFTIEDDSDTNQTFFDGLGRTIRYLDAENNEVLTTYDDNHNVIKLVELDRTQPLDVSNFKVPSISETFTTHYTYDALNRHIRTVDNLGQTTRYSYDSRDNKTELRDAQYSTLESELIPDPLGLSLTRINKAGNRTEYFYDGINRMISEVRELRVDGQGANSVDTSVFANRDGLIVMDYEYDANSRLIAQADDGSTAGDQNTSIGVIESSNPLGNVTRYQYDDLNRHARTIYDDATTLGKFYDADHNLIRYIDPNGSIHDQFYDGLNRLLSHDIIRATSSSAHPLGGFKDRTVTWAIAGTTIQEFEYDGLSRITRSFDNNSPEDLDDDSEVTRAYDSLSRVLEEVQNGEPVSSQWAGDDNRLKLLYSGPREVSYTYDNLDRIDTIGDAITSVIADYDYIGRWRILERSYANNTALSFLDAARQSAVGYDNLRRIVNLEHRNNSNSALAGFSYSYDRANNKLNEIKTHQANATESYLYDSKYRLTQTTDLDEVIETYELDGANNRVNVDGVQTLPNNLNEYGTFQGRVLLYDDNGNLVDDGDLRYIYDADDRLREVLDASNDNLIAEYFYDAFGRRIAKSVSNSGDLDGITEYIYDGVSVIEEFGSNSAIVFLHGARVDEPLSMDLDSNLDFEPDATFYYHEDARAHIIALSDENGEIVEEISYNPFGVSSIEQSEFGNPYMFTARRLDAETGLYFYRSRYYDPQKGRFIQRNPMGSWYDPYDLGNGYTYAGNNPITWKDPTGMPLTATYTPVDSNIKASSSTSAAQQQPFERLNVYRAGKLQDINPCPTTPRARKLFIGELSFTEIGTVQTGTSDDDDDDDSPPGTIVVAPPDQVPPPAPAPDWDRPTKPQLKLTMNMGNANSGNVGSKKWLASNFGMATATAQSCCDVSCSCQPPDVRPNSKPGKPQTIVDNTE